MSSGQPHTTFPYIFPPVLSTLSYLPPSSDSTSLVFQRSIICMAAKCSTHTHTHTQVTLFVTSPTYIQPLKNPSLPPLFLDMQRSCLLQIALSPFILSLPCLPTDLALETCQKSLHSQKMLPLMSQRRFVLLYNGETTDLWPRLGSSRPPIRLPYPNSNPPRPICEVASSALSSARATLSERPSARKLMPSRGAPICASRKSRLSDLGGSSIAESEPSLCSGPLEGSRDTAGEPSLGPPEEEREEEQRSTSHRGS